MTLVALIICLLRLRPPPEFGGIRYGRGVRAQE